MPAHERRVSPRILQGNTDRIAGVRVRPGIDVVLVDVSARGLLLETSHRLLPGAALEIHVSERAGRTVALRGHVVRCSVAVLLPGEIRYRGAVRFERAQSWLTEPAVQATDGACQSTGANPTRELDTQQAPDDSAHPSDFAADPCAWRPRVGWHRVW